VEFSDLSVARTRISDQVKEALKEVLLDMKPGEKIPSEERMARQFKVSKVTIREALSHLEAEGLLDRRRGVFGGSFVAMPSSGKMGEVVMNYYRMGDVTPEHLVEFRRILEPTLAELAASRRTDEELEALKRTIDEFEKDLREGSLKNRDPALKFHCLVAEMCHNALTSHVMRALVVVFTKVLDLFPLNTDDAWGDLNYCKQLYECFMTRDSEGARRVMVSHFDTLQSIIDMWRATQTAKDKSQEDGA
jgi:GntR family transcriptional repressor for pyruvate dehydrogenase complex